MTIEMADSASIIRSAHRNAAFVRDAIQMSGNATNR